MVRENIKRLLEDSVNLEAGSSENGQLDWESLVAEGRNPGEAIAAEAAKHETDLIVMSPKRRPLRATILGSTAEQICHTAACSVLILSAESSSTQMHINISSGGLLYGAGGAPESNS